MKFLKRTRFLCITIGVLIISSAVNGQIDRHDFRVPNGETIPVTKFEDKIRKVMDSLDYPGISISIINNSKIVYSNVFGLANSETIEKVTVETVFQGASLSKPLFAYFIMKMMEEGKINLDSPIFPFLEPVFPKEAIEENSLENYKLLTPRMILSHTTGIPNWTQGKPISIAFKPGTGFSYSGEAYQHLGAAFSLKNQIDWGRSLDKMIEEFVTKPLNMKRSFYVWDESFVNTTARGHSDGTMIPEINKYKKVGPGFSLHSNARDYAYFLLEMLDPKNIKISTRDTMLKEAFHFDENHKLFKETGQTGWGLGFAQKQTINGLVHLHTGKNPGFECYAMFIPEQKYGFVIFGNANNLSPLLRSIETLIGKHF